MIRFFLAVMMAVMAFSGFAGELVLSHISVIKTDYASRGDDIRDIRREATLKVRFVPRQGTSEDDARELVRQALSGPFFKTFEGAPCYPSNQIVKGETEKVRVERWVKRELRGLPLKKSPSVIYTCQ